MNNMLAHFGKRRSTLMVGMLILWLAVSASASVWGQTEDPLGKPSIWAQLADNPRNNQLWSEYFGKDLFDLSKEEGVKFRTWRTELIQAKSSGDFARPQVQADGEAALNKLTNNIAKNFVLIEDYFGSEFKKLDAEYITYGEKYPDGSYNKILWVEDHERKLKELWHSP